jgi:hypothetical protein
VVVNAGERAVTVLGYNVALTRRDGGGQRVQAFLRALKCLELDVNFLGIGPQGTDELQAITTSPVHRLKRRFLPVPLRRKSEVDIADVDISPPTISLANAVNRVALQAGGPCWLDFPDLWSDMARTHAVTVDPLSALFNRAQAWLWSRREALEYQAADVVTVASPLDVRSLGPNAVWLPTPITDSVPAHRRPSKPRDAGIVCGLIANFDYPPNRHAYDRLVRQWLPALLPAVSKVVVAGFGSERLPGVAGIEIIGAVDAIADFYDQIDVALAPIDRGGGMKVKVIEAMMYGVPVITAEHARGGLPDVLSAECIEIDDLLTNSSPEWVSRIRDPREGPEAAKALQSFTFANFQGTVHSLWERKMP